MLRWALWFHSLGSPVLVHYHATIAVLKCFLLYVTSGLKKCLEETKEMSIPKQGNDARIESIRNSFVSTAVKPLTMTSGDWELLECGWE